jgi:hypothetical protein
MPFLSYNSSSSKVRPINRKKPQPSTSDIEKLEHASEVCDNYEGINVEGQNCKDICMIPGRSPENEVWKKCKEKLNPELNFSGGKRKTKKYRNKTKRTKRKRSYSSKKT